MFGLESAFKIDKLKEKKQIQLDEMGGEAMETPSFEDMVEFAKLFTKLRELVIFLLSASDLGVKNWEEFQEILLSDLSDEEIEEFETLVYKFMRYIGIPDEAIENLIGDDEELSQAEFESLVEMLSERIGDGDIDEFIAYAIINPDLPESDEIDFDSLQMDWAFYPSLEECRKGTGLREVPYNSKTQRCVKGFSKGIRGYWRVPKGDFPNGDYKRKDGGTRRPNAIPNEKFKTKKHTPQADRKRMKDMEKRAKLGLPVFKGYLKTKKKKTSAKEVI
jgi:hypothetical protein